MDILELIKQRHSVRQYLDKKIEIEKRKVLLELAQKCNQESGLNIQLIFDEPKCFKSFLAKVMKFKNCTNYIALVGKKNDPDLEIKVGYFGEKIVLKAQEIGLNTCWVAATHGKSVAKIESDEKLVIVIALGYGETQGIQHKNKELSAISNIVIDLPDWYEKGLEAALLAPTAVNQQKFYFYLEDNVAKLSPGKGFNTMIDVGIVKYHFEVVTGYEVQIIK